MHVLETADKRKQGCATTIVRGRTAALGGLFCFTYCSVPRFATEELIRMMGKLCTELQVLWKKTIHAVAPCTTDWIIPRHTP